MIRTAQCCFFALLACSLIGQNAPSPTGTHASQPSEDPKAIAVSASPDSAVTVQVVNRVDAVFPQDALKQKRQGEVVLNVGISFVGDVVSTDVVNGDPALAAAAVEAAKRWKFKAWKYMDLPIRSWAKLAFDFKIPETLPGEAEPAVLATGRLIDSGGVGDPIGPPPLVTKGILLKRVTPKYPKAAKKAKIEGSVVLALVIGKDGTVKDVHVVSGPNELVDAAMVAVKQWRYRPYKLLGQFVEANTTVTVNFQLRQ